MIDRFDYSGGSGFLLGSFVLSEGKKDGRFVATGLHLIIVYKYFVSSHKWLKRISHRREHGGGFVRLIPAVCLFVLRWPWFVGFVKSRHRVINHAPN